MIFVFLWMVFDVVWNGCLDGFLVGRCLAFDGGF